MRNSTAQANGLGLQVRKILSPNEAQLEFAIPGFAPLGLREGFHDENPGRCRWAFESRTVGAKTKLPRICRDQREVSVYLPVVIFAVKSLS